MKMMRELRRRRVFGTVALYIIPAWVAVQVASLIFPALDIPERAIRYVWLPWVVHPNAYGGAVEPMREHPVFKAIVEQMNIPAAQPSSH